ncbi:MULTISPECIES: siderophore-interacting protein [Providencia]|uniref:siderophore-interacting protein n=1 Tax=Providencia TaxID=586 RepID=UPI0008FB4675|nr:MULTISPECIES: siderophore-interacting protein [Providencia]APC11691.1 Vibriobactin utilization protein ViuB [Providencia rettgeri]AVL75034.1 siderophore-interacting protein [Providencia rettgeri]EKH6494826.1 siderophore-interacting protein [Providencia rettgeri]ELR5051585.1 siderophore-interacting protein [Providencia rettgeri]ELR5153488.1 siderophore-interacting protein [Providencia rettgeri]
MATEQPVEKNIYRPAPPQLIQVKSIRDVSPSIRCITFTGEKLSAYPTGCEGGHLKIFLAPDLKSQPALPVLTEKGRSWPENEPHPFVRTYSVRAIRPEIKEIDIEFAMHDGVTGPAYLFARDAKPGNWMGITNPGGPDPLLPIRKHYFMAGDSSSLPAIAALLEKMPKDAQGKVVLRLDSQEDIRELEKPQHVEIIWICGDITKTDALISTFKSWDIPTSDTAFWIAGEDQIIRDLRRFIRREKGFGREDIYAIPYWRHGYDEEGYHHERHAVMDNPDD